MDRGFDAVSVEEVAETVDLSVRTVYRYFPTKEDLVLADLADRLAELLDVIDRQPGGTTIGEMLKVATVEWASNSREQLLLRSEAALIVATPALLARLLQMMAQFEQPVCARFAERSGHPTTDLDLCQLAALYCATIRIVVREWAAGNVTNDIIDFGLTAVEALELLPAANLPAANLPAASLPTERTKSGPAD